MLLEPFNVCYELIYYSSKEKPFCVQLLYRSEDVVDTTKTAIKSQPLLVELCYKITHQTRADLDIKIDVWREF